MTNPKIKRRIQPYHKDYYEAHRERILANTHRYYRNHKEEILARRKLQDRLNGNKLKIKVFSHYSNGKPQCHNCNIGDLDVLCIDHIDGGGGEHRRKIKKKGGGKFYRWLKNNNYPNGYQVLCANCNLKKEIHGNMII